jgi:hypothetical protein
MKLEQKQMPKSNSSRTGFLDAAVLVSGLAIYALCANPPEAPKPQVEIITETRTVRDGDTLYPFLCHEVHPINLLGVGLYCGMSHDPEYPERDFPTSLGLEFGEERSVHYFGRTVTVRAEMGHEPETAVFTISEPVNSKQ